MNSAPVLFLPLSVKKNQTKKKSGLQSLFTVQIAPPPPHPSVLKAAVCCLFYSSPFTHEQFKEKLKIHHLLGLYSDLRSCEITAMVLGPGVTMEGVSAALVSSNELPPSWEHSCISLKSINLLCFHLTDLRTASICSEATQPRFSCLQTALSQRAFCSAQCENSSYEDRTKITT